MSSQSNQSKNSIKKISDYVLSEQNIDIKNYTAGHLNEDHLYKIPNQKIERKWKINQKNNLANKKSKKVKRTPSKPYSSLSDINEILDNFKDFGYSSPFTVVSESSSDFGYVDNKSLPPGLIKLPKLENLNKSKTGTETFSSESDLKNDFPITEKEMAISFLTGPFKGASKSEKFRNFTKFEKEVVQKDDLITNNIFHSTDRADFLEKKLQSVKN